MHRTYSEWYYNYGKARSNLNSQQLLKQIMADPLNRLIHLIQPQLTICVKLNWKMGKCLWNNTWKPSAKMNISRL